VTIGITQGIASVTGIVAAIANAPTILNLWYSSSYKSLDGQWTWPYKVTLLPSFYSNEEIAKQSSLIALYGVLYNKEKLLEGEALGSSASKHYIEKLRKLALSSYQDYDQALSTVITKKEEKDFTI
jgi:hypothetical protein